MDNHNDEPVPVGQFQKNIKYYQLLNDTNLKIKHTEATNIWFRLIMTNETNEQCVRADLLTTIAFWRHVIDVTEIVLKERGIDF